LRCQGRKIFSECFPQQYQSLTKRRAVAGNFFESRTLILVKISWRLRNRQAVTRKMVVKPFEYAKIVS